jgi:hypothetical protein
MQMTPPAMVNYGSPSMEAAKNASYFTIAALVAMIVYYQHIPFEYANFFKTFVGRIVAFVILLVLAEFGGLYHAALWAILFLFFQIRKTTIENFIGGFPFIPYNDIDGQVCSGRKTTHLVPEGEKRWFVERSLGETPQAIEETEVRTSAVQDESTQPFQHN